MIWLYRLIFWPIFILLLPGYLIKLWRRGGKWHIAERFGFVHPPKKQNGVRRIWVHAVSVGELNGVKPFLLKLKERPDVEVVLSVTTTTARKIAEEKMKELYAYLFTFPIDIFSGRTLRRLKADKLVLMEGELWPEMLVQAPKYGTQVYLINGRMSDRSFRRMMMGRGVVKYFLSKVERILTATKQDTERYLALGARPEIVSQTGSLKFDAVQSKPIEGNRREELLKSLGFTKNDIIIIGASTWKGEEATLIEVYKSLKAEFAHPQPLADHADHPSPKGDIRGLTPTNRGYTATQENPSKGGFFALSRIDRRSAAKREGGENDSGLRPATPSISGTSLKLLLVPRHAERRNEVLSLLKKSGANFHQRSAGPVSGQPDIVLADTTGELSSLVQVSHVAFVGKSFPPHKKGQTPIESAAAGKPVVMGYGMGDFRLIAQSLADEGGGKFVGGPPELKEFLKIILSDEAQRKERGEKARAWFEKNRGATAKTIEWLGI